MRIKSLVAAALLFAGVVAAPSQAAVLAVEGTHFVVDAGEGRVLRSEQLIGSIFDMVTPEGARARVRIDAVRIAADATNILLHDLKVEGPNGWKPMCDADAYGQRMAFPMAGKWNGAKFVADKAAWFLTCTSGSQAKCLLWGFDPWGTGKDGASLASLYQACQHMVRADYDGRGVAHTRNGTVIDGWDIYDVQVPATTEDESFAFEAGWGPDGAVCVARTRWDELLPLSVLLASVPRLKATPCDEAEARRRGAILFNRSKLRP